MALHKDLTGADLHEPKGIETAATDTIYLADGAGSGAWVDRFDGFVAANEYFLTGAIADVSTASSHAYFFIPVQSEMTNLSVVLDGAIAAADAILSIYVNGVLFADDLTVAFTGSTAGSAYSVSITTPNTVAGGAVVEVRSDGGSTNAVIGYVQLGLRAK